MKAGLIDWTEEGLHLYIAEKNDGYLLVDTAFISLNGGSIEDKLSALLKTHLDYIYLSLPLSMLSLRELEFPFSDRKKIRETIAFELEGLLLGSASNYTIDHIITHTSEDGCRVLAVCIEKTRLVEIIRLFSSVGLEPKVITSLDVCLLDSKGGGIIEYPRHNEDKKRMESALKELTRPTLNLRQGELQYRGDIEGVRKAFRLTVILAMVLLLIFSTNTVLRLISLKNENELITHKIKEIYKNTFPEDKRIIDPVRQFTGKFNRLMKKRTIFGTTSSIEILKDIANLKDKNITLNEFKAGEDGILIKGIATSFEDVESFRDRLSSLYNEVKVLDSALSGNNEVNFTIMMKERAV